MPNDTNVNLTPAASKAVTALRTQQAADSRVVVSPAVAAEMLDIRATKLRELVEYGELASLLDGRNRRIVVSSIYDRLVKIAIASNTSEGLVKRHGFLGTRPGEAKPPRKTGGHGGARAGAGRPAAKAATGR